MPSNSSEECRAVQVAKAFFQATTKLSEDNEDILPQVGRAATLSQCCIAACKCSRVKHSTPQECKEARTHLALATSLQYRSSALLRCLILLVLRRDSRVPTMTMFVPALANSECARRMHASAHL